MANTPRSQLKTHPDDLDARARRVAVDVALLMLDVELNKVQTETVYIRFPTTFENREAARERGFQGERIGEIGSLLEELGVDPTANLSKGMTSLAGAGLRPRFFAEPLADWNEFLVFRYLRDRARSFWALGFLGTDYVPLAVAVARVLMHCALNSDRPLTYATWSGHQIERIRERCAAGDGEAIQRALNKWYPLAKAIIGSPREDEELASGIRGRPSHLLGELFADTVGGEMKGLGLTIPETGRLPAPGKDALYRNARDPLPPAYREKLVRLLKMHLASEYTTAFMESLLPPTAMDLAEWMETIREEGEHGDGIVEILADLGEDAQPVVHDVRFGEGKHLLDFFKVEIENWDEVGIMRWLSERAAGYQSLAALGSSYIPFAIWSARNYMDEGMAHAQIGRAIVEKAIAAGRKADVQRLMLKRWPYVLDYFGNERPGNEHLALGIKMRPNFELRRRWLRDMERDAAGMGLKMPAEPLKGVRADYGAVQAAE